MTKPKERMVIKPAPIKALEEFFAEPRCYGRFHKIKMSVLDSIENCPKNEFRIIEVSKELKQDKKERNAVYLALLKPLKAKNWKMRWSDRQKVFYLFRNGVKP